LMLDDPWDLSREKKLHSPFPTYSSLEEQLTYS
jgi:hypothetical protein